MNDDRKCLNCNARLSVTSRSRWCGVWCRRQSQRIAAQQNKNLSKPPKQLPPNAFVDDIEDQLEAYRSDPNAEWNEHFEAILADREYKASQQAFRREGTGDGDACRDGWKHRQQKMRSFEILKVQLQLSEKISNDTGTDNRGQ